MGRPPEPVPETFADEVVGWLEQGKPLRQYCRQAGKPARRTVDDWRRKDPNFAARVARAREVGFSELAEQALEIADQPQLEKGAVARDRLRIDTRLKLLACWDPRRYGNKVQLGEDEDRPFRRMSDTEREQRIRELMSRAEARKNGSA